MGDSESVSVKSMQNVIRYNTVINNPGAQFVFRNGDNNVAYANYVLGGSGGFRVKQANNIGIYNNYVEGYTSKSAAAPVGFEYFPSTYMQNITVAHNTFVNVTSVDLCNGGPCKSPLQGVTFANNIFFQPVGPGSSK